MRSAGHPALSAGIALIALGVVLAAAEVLLFGALDFYFAIIVGFGLITAFRGYQVRHYQ